VGRGVLGQRELHAPGDFVRDCIVVLMLAEGTMFITDFLRGDCMPGHSVYWK
jgi:hypothetical protein